MLYTTFNPWHQISDLQREMNRLFDGTYRETQFEYPALNIWTDNDKVMVTSELPGYEKKDVDISLTGDVLRLHGNRVAPQINEEECFHRQERNYGDFSREIKLPFTINPDLVDAVFKNGVLKITLHRAEENKPKKIEINTK